MLLSAYAGLGQPERGGSGPSHVRTGLSHLFRLLGIHELHPERDSGEDTELGGRATIAGRVSDEVSWLRHCAGWLVHLDADSYPPAVNLRPAAGWPDLAIVAVNVARVAAVIDRIAADDKHLGRLERWLVRKSGEHGLPSTIDAAAGMVDADVADLRELARLLPPDEYAVRLAVDTNTLIDNPDLAAHVGALGRRYMAHLLPVVLREIDDLKRGGKTPQLREAAQRADRRLKGLRDNGDVLSGVRVAGEVHAVFEHVEPKDDRLPSWLDLAVPDDRFAASCLLLQAEHPGSALYVATGDLNLQTKLTAIGLPFIELPAPP